MSDRLGLLRIARLMLNLEVELSPQPTIGEITMSRFEKLTHVLALPISHSMGTQIPLSSVKGRNSQGGV